MAEWQTHQTQNLTLATVCGFKSHLLQLVKPVEVIPQVFLLPGVLKRTNAYYTLEV